MKKIKQIFSIAIMITLAFVICSCNQDAAPSLFLEKSNGDTPVIASISPANQGLAGVTQLTITGTNFSNDVGNIMVFFGNSKATVIQSSSTQIVVTAPNVIANNLDVKVAVLGAVNFSNILKYNLVAATGVYYNFSKGIDEPMSVTVDKSENVYVSVSDKGIKKISATGTLTDFAPKGAESFWSDLKMGPNNTLYGTRSVRAVFQIQQGATATTFATVPTGIVLTTLDFDASGNIWTGGTGGNFYSITSGKVVTAFPIDYTISSIRVYNGYLYVAGKKDTEEAIYRFKINSNSSLGTQEKFFDIGAAYGLKKVNVGAITFSSDGDLIIGTDQTDAFIKVTAGTASVFYPGLLSPFVRSFCWGSQNNLFYIKEYLESSTTYHALVRVNMQKTSAPYYGRQ